MSLKAYRMLKVSRRLHDCVRFKSSATT